MLQRVSLVDPNFWNQILAGNTLFGVWNHTPFWVLLLYVTRAKGKKITVNTKIPRCLGSWRCGVWTGRYRNRGRACDWWLMTSVNQNLYSSLCRKWFWVSFLWPQEFLVVLVSLLLLEITLSQQGVSNMSIGSLRLCFSHWIHLVFRVASHAGHSASHTHRDWLGPAAIIIEATRLTRLV